MSAAAGVERVGVRLFGDPTSRQGSAALRRALRVALVMPSAFAASTILARNAEVTTFVAFGCFALMVLADFGGPRRPRALAYLLTVAAGAGLIATGTLASNSPWSAVVATLVLAFGVRFAGFFGGYVRAAQGALLLSLVLAVAFPGPPQTIVPRLIGWLIAGALATVAGLVLWPAFEMADVRQRAATACRALAELVAAARDPEPAVIHERSRAAGDSVRALFRDYYATLRRPTWPTRRDQALAALIIDLDSTVAFAVPSLKRLNEPATPTSPAGGHPWIEEGYQVSAMIVQTLRDCGDLLTGGGPPDLSVLESAQMRHRTSLDRWAGEALRSGRPIPEVLDQLHVDNRLSFLIYLTLAIGTNAILAAGQDLAGSASGRFFAPRRGGSGGMVIWVGKSIRDHLAPSSPALHDAVRVAIGFAVAVLIGRLLALPHAFWVVLGTSSALRSNVLATGRTAFQAVAGTLIGVIVGGLGVVLIGTNAIAAWAVLPLAAFAATYVSGAAGFVLGQAAFSVFVIILFNLIAPAGWQIGLARIEDVGLGVGISVVTGLLLWPQGTRRDLTDAIAKLFAAAGAFLGESLELVLGRGSSDRAKQEKADAVRAQDRANEALEQFLAERTAGPLSSEGAASLVASGTHAVFFGRLIDVLPALGYRADRQAAELDVLEAQVQRLVGELSRQADRIEGRNGKRAGVERVSATALQEVALASLGQMKDDPSVQRSTFAVIAASDWIQFLDDLVARLDRPIDEAVAAARLPWWR